MLPTIAWGVVAGLLIGWQWPEFRGANGAGKAQASGLPLTWSETSNIRDDLLYMTTDAGVASAVEARTGQVVWTGRFGGTHSASPVYADGRVYFFSEDGETVVIEAGRTFKVLAKNQLGDGFMASPAITGKAFILRSRTYLYRVEA